LEAGKVPAIVVPPEFLRGCSTSTAAIRVILDL
jgi:hypothetical protein